MSKLLLVTWVMVATWAVLRVGNSLPARDWFHRDLPWQNRIFWLYRGDWRETVVEEHFEKVLVFRRRLRTMLFVLLLLPILVLLLSLLFLYATL